MPAIRKLFAAAFESLTSAMLLRAQDMESRRFGIHVKLQKYSSRSLLSSIIGVEETVGLVLMIELECLCSSSTP